VSVLKTFTEKSSIDAVARASMLDFPTAHRFGGIFHYRRSLPWSLAAVFSVRFFQPLPNLDCEKIIGRTWQKRGRKN